MKKNINNKTDRVENRHKTNKKYKTEETENPRNKEYDKNKETAANQETTKIEKPQNSKTGTKQAYKKEQK